MGVFKLFQFFAEAGDYASPDQEDLDQAGDDAPRHAAFYRVIVYVSASFGVIGALAGVALTVMTATEPKAGWDGAQILLAPVMFGAIGLVFGVAVACLFAPRSFLLSPVGQKWMKLIGTQSVLGARIVCFILAALIAGVPTALGLVILLKP